MTALSLSPAETTEVLCTAISVPTTIAGSAWGGPYHARASGDENTLRALKRRRSSPSNQRTCPGAPEHGLTRRACFVCPTGLGKYLVVGKFVQTALFVVWLEGARRQPRTTVRLEASPISDLSGRQHKYPGPGAIPTIRLDRSQDVSVIAASFSRYGAPRSFSTA